jgi:uncharacterized protein (TIGR00369 family)
MMEEAMTGGSVSKTHGTVSAERHSELSGLEFVQGLATGALPLNTIAETLGYDVAEAESGRVVVTMVPTGAHLNPAGTVHGGLAATLLDSCMGLAIQSTLDKAMSQTTLEFKISLLRPITPETGPIRAEGMVLNRGRRIGTAEGRVTDGKGRLLAHGTTTCLIFQSRLRQGASVARKSRPGTGFLEPYIRSRRRLRGWSPQNERPVRGDNRTGQSHMGAWGGWALAPNIAMGRFSLPHPIGRSKAALRSK